MWTRIPAFVLLLVAIATSMTGATEVLAPVSGSVLSLAIAGHQTTYFRLAADSSLDLIAVGPGTITALVRLAIPVEFKGDTAHYSIVVFEGTDTVRSVNAASVPADAEWVGPDERPGLLRKFSLHVPEGANNYRFHLVRADGPYAGVRFVMKRPSPHASDSPLYPVAMERMLTLVYHERRLDYHLATAAVPVKVRVIGPTRLRAITRLVYSATMKGSQKYALAFTLDGQALKPEDLQTTKAINSEFEEEADWVPGKSRTVYVPIPAGEHELTVTPRATDAPGVALRFTLPSGDVDTGDGD